MQFISHSLTDTYTIGERIAKILKPSDTLAFLGPLGSGKTQLVKGIAQGLGLDKRLVNSPSFVLIRHYATKKMPLYHLDLYRLNRRRDFLSLGLEEYMYSDGITLIEWADKIRDMLPKDYLLIKLKITGENFREINLIPFGNFKERLKLFQVN